MPKLGSAQLEKFQLELITITEVCSLACLNILSLKTAFLCYEKVCMYVQIERLQECMFIVYRLDCITSVRQIACNYYLSYCQGFEKKSNALSFYMSKMILDHPKCFGRLQIVFVRSKPFWSGPNHFGQVQIRLLWTNLYNLDPTKTNWTRPKRLVLNQNDLDSHKIILDP